MNVELLVIPGCPGAEKASKLLRKALNDVGFPDVTFAVEVIDSDDLAQSRGFAGSPAFLVDGLDLFDPDGGHGTMTCRVYPTPDGPRNVPALQDLIHALKQQTATA